jgi:hypothetical protein
MQFTPRAGEARADSLKKAGFRVDVRLGPPLATMSGSQVAHANFRFYIFRKETLQCGKWVWLLWPS